MVIVVPWEGEEEKVLLVVVVRSGMMASFRVCAHGYYRGV